MATRQQLEAQLVAAHRSGNVAAAQQAAYAIRAFDQNSLMAQVPTVNAPAVNRPVQPRWDDMLTQFSQGLGSGIKSQLQGVEQIVTQPVESAKALYQAGVEAFRDPAKALGEAWSGIRSTAERAVSSPMGFGQVLGENVNIVRVPGGRRQPTQAELDVYHGTPHTFEPEEGAPLGRFRSSKIGTGEGAQAYGHGLYLAQSPDIAGGYAYNLGYRAGNLPTVNGKPITDLYRRIEDKAATMSPEASRVEYQKLDFLEQLMQEQGTPAKVLAGLKGQEGVYPQAVDWFKKEVAPKYKGPGTTYKVDLPDAKIEQMLDWDKPLKEQPKEVRQALTRLAQNAAQSDEQLMKEFQKLGASATGDLLYATLVQRAVRLKKYEGMRAGIPEDKAMPSLTYGQQIASEQLRQAGIPGIKYLDAGSRDGGKGTRNFVVFPGEEQNLTILSRD